MGEAEAVQGRGEIQMTWCIVCGFGGTADEVRRHQFSEHYQFYMMQCSDDAGLVRKAQEEK